MTATLMAAVSATLNSAVTPGLTPWLTGKTSLAVTGNATVAAPGRYAAGYTLVPLATIGNCDRSQLPFLISRARSAVL